MSHFTWKVTPIVRRVTRPIRVIFSNKYLLLTNTAISVSLSITGDIIQQNYQIMQKNISSWNQTRMLHVACSGLAIGPFCHYWYHYLDRWFPGKTLRIVMKKVLLDQIVCSPIYIGLYFVTIGMLEKMTWKEIAAESLVKGSTIYTMEWLIWPPAQLINFFFLPTKYRVLYDNVIGLGFDTYFSNVKYHSKTKKCEVESERSDIDCIDSEEDDDS